MHTSTARELFDQYWETMAYVWVEYPDGTEGMGSAFHVGEGVFVTARHVVEGNRIVEVGKPERLPSRSWNDNDVDRLRITRGPHFPDNPDVDLAVFRADLLGVQGQVIDRPLPWIALGGHLDDFIGLHDFVLNDAIVLGFPPIPMTRYPVLVAARAEVNAVIDLRDSAHVHFVLSTMPRGGFSGGPAILSDGSLLGVVTRSLVANSSSEELGYLSVLAVEPVYECLARHRMLPTCQVKELPEIAELVHTDTVHLIGPTRLVSASVEIFDDGNTQAITIHHHKDNATQDSALTAARANSPLTTRSAPRTPSEPDSNCASRTTHRRLHCCTQPRLQSRCSRQPV
ncbi:serine protease [Nocardia sp. CWNU-33]|uniref:S1 family peptidase n=1 Tax=Nocardia sp. CWNU-33 TaxID=3392117 RepID=UPI00398EA3EF